jgi:hypothetical protein
VLSKLAYLTLCRSIQLFVLLAHGEAAKDLEILAVPHQLTVLRRQLARPKLEPADRAVLAAFSRAHPVPAGHMLRRQPRHAAALAPPSGRRRPDLPASSTRPPPTRRGLPTADRPPGQGEPRWDYQRSKENSNASACAFQQPRYAPHSAATGSTLPCGRRAQHGARSCASRPQRSSPATSSPSTPSGCGGYMCCSSSNWTPGWSTWPG